MTNVIWKMENAPTSYFLLLILLSILLLESLQLHVEGLDSQSEERGGFGLVIVGLAERGIDQAALEIVNQLWQIDSARRDRLQRGVADARREQRLVDQLRLSRADGAFQRGFEFVDISLPGIIRKHLQRPRSDFVWAFAQALGDSFRQTTGQIRNVFTAFPQRLDCETGRAQHFDQTVRDSILGLDLGRIPFGREDQTRPLMSARIGAPALLFDVSGEALLQQRRKARQFVDIDRAAPAGLNHPAGPEQKVVQRVAVQTVRVDCEKGLRRILARGVQRPRDLLLPQPPLADDQRRSVRHRLHADELLERGDVYAHAGKTIVIVQSQRARRTDQG